MAARLWLCVALLAVTGVVGTSKNLTAIAEGISPADFVTLGDKQYYFSSSDVGPHSANDAMRLCSELGMRLLSMETQAEAAMIENQLKTRGQDFYTSGKRSEGQWLWAGSGLAFGYSNWGTNYPKNAAGEDSCVISYRGVWYDQPCSYTEHFICEQVVACQ